MASASSGGGARRAGEVAPHRWLILAVIGLAQLMIVLDATVMNIALPSAQAELGFSNDSRQWIVTAYSLAFGSLLLLGGRLSDLFGRKLTFIVGLLGFALASALGGAAGNFEMLVLARALQGVFGALLAPAALSLLTTTFNDPKERGKAFGIFGAIAGAGGAIGLLLGGVLTEYLNWRWCLYVNLVFAAVALVGALMFLVPGRHADRPTLDIPGTVVVTAGLFCVVFGLSRAETRSWGSPSVWGFLVAGAVLLVLFVMIERKVAHPLLPMRIVRDRDRGGAYLAVFIAGAGMFGIFLFLTYYMQTTLGYTPVKTGLAFLPMVAGIMITAQVSTIVLLPRIGAKIPIAAGMVLAAIGLVWLTTIQLDSVYVTHVMPQLIVCGLGMGLIIAPAMNVATAGVAELDAGVASAMVNTSQQVGGSIGTALLSTLANNAATAFIAGKQPTPQLLAEAALKSYTTAFWWSAVIFAAGAIACGLLLRRGKHEPGIDSPAMLAG
ncbi:MFS transporter [Phytomonospora sp. NPDC050363]|uniref:MFS transporter n=1 Tax=Phytomonospora sp. NPDC050363 TaxID=3155642 RepID=UPI0034067B67